VFRLLGAVTVDAAWAALVGRCWYTVTSCGLPRRIRPGFWDNNGRCCGTAGVLAVACDRHVEQGTGRDPAYAVPWPDHPDTRGPGGAEPP